MADEELTKVCALAMGYVESRDGLWNNGWYCGGSKLDRDWNPLHDRAQAMELVERFGLSIIHNSDDCHFYWTVGPSGMEADDADADDDNLLRAICLCISRLSRST